MGTLLQNSASGANNMSNYSGGNFVQAQPQAGGMVTNNGQGFQSNSFFDMLKQIQPSSSNQQQIGQPQQIQQTQPSPMLNWMQPNVRPITQYQPQAYSMHLLQQLLSNSGR